jgi:hypothetical protein
MSSYITTASAKASFSYKESATCFVTPLEDETETVSAATDTESFCANMTTVANIINIETNNVFVLIFIF